MLNHLKVSPENDEVMADVTRRWITCVLVTILACVLFPACGMCVKEIKIYVDT